MFEQTWILVRFPAFREAVGTTQSPIQWGPKNTQFYAVPTSRTRGGLPPLLGSILPLHKRLLYVVLNLVLGTFFFPFLLLRFSYDVFERKLLGEDFEPLKSFIVFNTDLYSYIRIHTNIHIYVYNFDHNVPIELSSGLLVLGLHSVSFGIIFFSEVHTAPLIYCEVTFLRKFGKLLPDCMASYPRGL